VFSDLFSKNENGDILNLVVPSSCGRDAYTGLWYQRMRFVVKMGSMARYMYHVRYEVSTAVTINNTVLWDIKTQFVLQRGHIMSPLRIQPVNVIRIRFEGRMPSSGI
jgi:hypothetical protein